MPVTLDDILITEELSNRSPRPPNFFSENQALHTLARQLVKQPETMLQTLVDISLDLCSAGTAGVSLLETTSNGEEVFRPNVLAGTLAQYVGGTTPRNFSPCGVCLERGTPVLFSHPERYFTYFQEANTPIVEGLVLPLIAGNHALGTIWIMLHDEQRHFDSEDVRVMTSLADFTVTALLLNQRQTQELLAKNTQLEAEVIERKQAETALRESEERWHLALDAAEMGTFLWFPQEDRSEPPPPVRMYGTAADITVAKHLEEDRKRREAHLAFLADIAEDFSRLSSADEIMRAVGAKVGTYLNISNCLFAEINEGQNQAIVEYTWHTPDTPDVTGVYRLSDFITEEFRQAARAEETIIIRDTQTDPRVDRDRYAALKIHAYVTVPFHREGEWKYLFTVNDSVARNWCEDEIELIREVTNRTFPRLERAYAEAALRESELQRVREQSAREQERQRAESLAELDRAKTLFFSNVSHEFRTPLTLLLAPLQDALSDVAHPLDPVHRERLELAQPNATRLLKLVNTLLDFSRIEAGRMEAVYEPTDLALFTTELASVFRSAIERAGLRLIVDCPPLPEPVYVDRQMWDKIVLNLLSNAFKFTLEGEIAVRLHPTDGDRVMLQVQDTGTGIPPEELPHVFERFYQVRRTKARTYEGSGIGLALVHELIRLHGGTVDVSSTLGQGTCFTITIPLGTEHLPSDRLRLDVGDRITGTRTLASTAIGAASYVEEAERWLPAEGNREQETGNREEVSTPPDLDPPQPPLKRGENSVKVSLQKGDLGGSSGLRTEPTPSPACVLLVDDNADIRDYLTRILSEHVQVEAVADGAAALAAAQERVPDLVLTDVMMPGLDGFGLLKALRADPRTREIPIILLSARAGQESVIEGLEAGADDYLIKPFSAQELVSRVKGHLQMAQLRLESLHQERTINRRKDELLSTVSHELNTPLVAILGWTRLLRANPSNQSMLMKALETIERNATLQAKLIQDLLDISRINAGKLRLNLEPVELESVIENAIASVSHLAQAKEIDLVWWGVQAQQSDTPTQQNVDSVVVIGDRDRLQQILYNLLTNAIKFTPNQGNINMELSVIESHNSCNASIAEISITDTGIGIPAEFLPHVFDRFCQAESPDAAKGLGLGLAIARHLVELHGGTIQAESTGVDRGTTFTIKLPLIANR